MRKLTGLDDKLTALIDETKPENIEAMPTYRHCLKLAAGQGKSKTADEARRLVRVLGKLRVDGDVELQDEEFRALVERVSSNTSEFITSIQGQILERLDASDK